MNALQLSPVSDWTTLRPGDFVAVVMKHHSYSTHTFQGFIKDIFPSYHPDDDFTTFTVTNPVLDDPEIGQVRTDWDITPDTTTVYAY